MKKVIRYEIGDYVNYKHFDLECKIVQVTNRKGITPIQIELPDRVRVWVSYDQIRPVYTQHMSKDFLQFDFSDTQQDPHYKKEVEPIDLIDAFNLDFNAGNVIKYVSRAKHKENELEDLRKAKYYLDRLYEKAKASKS